MKKKFLESSFTLTVIYTIGHVLIAMACNIIINKVSFYGALTDGIVEPLINAVWFYFIHKLVKNYFYQKQIHQTLQAIENILSRNSVSKLEGPHPSPEEMTLVYKSALRAPDHRWLRPSEFIEVTGDGLKNYLKSLKLMLMIILKI